MWHEGPGEVAYFDAVHKFPLASAAVYKRLRIFRWNWITQGYVQLPTSKLIIIKWIARIGSEQPEERGWVIGIQSGSKFVRGSRSEVPPHLLRDQYQY